MVAANNLSGRGGPRFSVVRYGNVIGSRGSVVPFFDKLISEGAKELPITHPDMTRFWITIDQGVSFVLSSLGIMQGGEILVPKIPSMKIVDLAKAIAPQLVLKSIGIRPGEKLHELMITEDDARMTIDLGDRYAINPSLLFAEHKPLQGKAVPDGFSYASDKNAEWLDGKGLLALMGRAPA
jgi:UDP-N-acetylglucosamine 4,6-dehydratase